MRSNSSLRPSESSSDASSLPRASMVLKMPNAGGQVPTQMVAPASASDLAMAKPKPPSSATPATSARFPRRSMASMARTIDRARAAVKLDGHGFDDVGGAAGDDARQAKAGSGEERRVLGFGALLAAGHDQPVDVEQLGRRRRVAGRHHGFDD